MRISRILAFGSLVFPHFPGGWIPPTPEPGDPPSEPPDKPEKPPEKPKR